MNNDTVMSTWPASVTKTECVRPGASPGPLPTAAAIALALSYTWSLLAVLCQLSFDHCCVAAANRSVQHSNFLTPGILNVCLRPCPKISMYWAFFADVRRPFGCNLKQCSLKDVNFISWMAGSNPISSSSL